jgi:two-component system, sensor histidine kinase FlrB
MNVSEIVTVANVQSNDNLLADPTIVDKLSRETMPLSSMPPLQSLTRLNAIFNELPAGLIILDNMGVVEQCNEQAVLLLGEPLLGQLWLDVIKRNFSPKADDGHEVSLQDGRRLSIATKPLSQAGQLILLNDLTATRALQDKRSREQRLSQIGKMVASVAHQIRTPLAAATLYAANLQNENLSTKHYIEFSQKILLRLRNIERQVSDMLLFAHGGESVIERISVQNLFAELNNRLEAQITAKQAKFCLRKITDNPILHCHRESVLGALQNLVINSLEAGGQGTQIEAIVEIIDDDRVKIIIKDNGPGICSSIKSQIFEPFFTTKSSGTGLGLAVVSAVAKAHQGEVIVSSIKGEGCQIGLILPLHPKQDIVENSAKTVGQ